MASTTDTRVVYGAMCTYWGSIQSVGTLDIGLPCCPHCRGLLFEMATEEAFLAGARKHEADGNPGYVAFVEWMKARRCFKHIGDAKRAYEVEQLAVQVAAVAPQTPETCADCVALWRELDAKLESCAGHGIDGAAEHFLAGVASWWVKKSLALTNSDAGPLYLCLANAFREHGVNVDE